MRPSKYIDIYQQDKNYLRAFFPYNMDIILHIKTIKGRKWEPKAKSWLIPCTHTAIEALVNIGFELSPVVKRWLTLNKDPQLAIPVLREKLHPNLFDYQLEGVQFLESRNGRALIADEPGLGKTGISSSWLQLHPRLRPVLIICPAVLKLNWKRELLMWTCDKRIQILKGERPYPIRADIVIINYDILTAWYETLNDYGFKIMILDEAHFIKNDKAKRTKHVRLLAKKIHHIIPLTGTPIVSRPIEFYNILNLLQPVLFPNRWHYAQRYCGAKYTGFGWDFNGASNIEELHEILTNSIMIRRLKKDVLTQLPPKIRCAVPLDIDQGAYETGIGDIDIEIEKKLDEFNKKRVEQNLEPVDKLPGAGLIKLEKLRQLTVSLKLPEVIQWIEQYLTNQDKLVVFTAHIGTIDHLAAHFKKRCVIVDGRTKNDEERQRSVDAFQNNPKIKVFLGNIKAAGAGLTLTAASATAMVEFLFTPGDMIQAEDRCHRVGATAECVYAYYLVAAGTIEESIARIIDNKAKVVGGVIDGHSTEEASMLTELIQELENH